MGNSTPLALIFSSVISKKTAIILVATIGLSCPSWADDKKSPEKAFESLIEKSMGFEFSYLTDDAKDLKKEEQKKKIVKSKKHDDDHDEKEKHQEKE
jgi:hypothetical protein